MRKASKIPIALLSLLLLSGCGGPSEGDARQILETKIQDESKGAIKLVSFTKVNGVPDGDHYKMEYQAVIEFLQDGTWTGGNKMDSQKSFGFSASSPGSGPMAEMNAALSGAQGVRRGAQETVTCSYLFEKTENGWRRYNPLTH